MAEPIPPSTECESDAVFSTPIPEVANGCYTPWCNDAFQSLPKASRIEVIGTNGSCMYKFRSDEPGMILSDGAGGFVFTDEPVLDLPALVSYVIDSTGTVATNQDRTAIEGDPPEFGYLMVQKDDGGEWMKLRGRPGQLSMLTWDGTEYKHIGMDEANLSVARPVESCDELEVIGFGTLECDDGEPNLLQLLEATEDGVLYFNSVTGKAKVTGLCALYQEEAIRSEKLPFVPGCVDGLPVKFKGPTDHDSILYWDFTNGEWAIMDMNTQICDPECGCGTYLIPVYDCATGTWQITEAPDHIETWKTWSDTGVANSIEFTLQWPAMVTFYALRRLIPQFDVSDTYSADIYVDGCKITSPSDGGLVGSFAEAASSMGLAIVPLAAGVHTVTVSNLQVSGTAVPQWNGAWLKAAAHKITSCDPAKPAIGAGVIVDGNANFGDAECVCAPGADGAAGPIGPTGEAGTPGAPGADGEASNWVYSIDTCPTATSLIWKSESDEGLEITTFFFKSIRTLGCLLLEDEDPCTITLSLSDNVPCVPDHSTGSPLAPDEYYIPCMTPAGTLDYLEVFPNPPSGDNQYYLACQAPDGSLSFSTLNFPSATTPDQMFALSQDAFGDVTVISLLTACANIGITP